MEARPTDKSSLARILRSDHVVVAALYLAITVVMTWPVTARLSTDLPGDLGDPAFVAGVIAWGSEHWLALFTGDLGAPIAFWNSPIFHPESLTLAYSEHFALHSLLTLPVYTLTRNPVLCYNLLFLSTFVIGAFGMYLLVRDAVGDAGRFSAAGFIAGLAFVFTPYRVAHVAHLQVLSVQWMPLVLFALLRYLRHGNSDWLLVTGLFLWAQNLSSGYYMLFFGPFVALFAIAGMVAHGAHRRLAVWRSLAVVAVVTFAATLPFALPYLERSSEARRTALEIESYSADLESWITASPLLHVWGHLQTLVKPEGALFPGLTVVVLALLGLWRGWRLNRSVTAFAGATFVVVFWLSLGPRIHVATHPVDFPALYNALMNVPGFSIARVPARFAAIAGLALAILSGIAVATLTPRWRTWMASVGALLVLAEGSAVPLPTNGTWTSAPDAILPPPARLYPLSEAPGIYPHLATLPARSVIAHVPFGLPEREIQYGYYAMLHQRRIVNGYSGAFPSSYNTRLRALRDPSWNVELTQTLLTLDGVTHVVVHTGAYVDGGGHAVLDLFARLGWRQAVVRAGDHLLER